jgi:hypothetical protein
LAELVSFDDCSDAHAIDMALRTFFHAHRPSPPADKCMGTLRNFLGGGMIENQNFIPALSPWSLLK